MECGHVEVMESQNQTKWFIFSHMQPWSDSVSKGNSQLYLYLKHPINEFHIHELSIFHFCIQCNLSNQKRNEECWHSHVLSVCWMHGRCIAVAPDDNKWWQDVQRGLELAHKQSPATEEERKGSGVTGHCTLLCLTYCNSCSTIKYRQGTFFKQFDKLTPCSIGHTKHIYFIKPVSDILCFKIIPIACFIHNLPWCWNIKTLYITYWLTQ